MIVSQVCLHDRVIYDSAASVMELFIMLLIFSARTFHFAINRVGKLARSRGQF